VTIALKTGVTKPVVGIPASVRFLEYGMPFHGTAQQYLRAVREDVGATVLTIPGTASDNAIELLDLLDGVLLTGSFSHIHPSTYGEPVVPSDGFYDEARDEVTLPLIRALLERDLPIFGICRGMQEMNVALGGSLSQFLQGEPSKNHYRPNENRPLAEQFGATHEIHIQPGGVLAGLVPRRDIIANTAHVQCVNRIADGLRVEAVTDDGIVEALSVIGAKSFAVGVQFHPEWNVQGNELYTALFGAFREAVWLHASRR
jgi:putative glutamine amidotransferase